MNKINYALSIQASLGKEESREDIILNRCPMEYGLKNIEQCYKIEAKTCTKCWEEEI